jgi:hypothetical protein
MQVHLIPSLFSPADTGRYVESSIYSGDLAATRAVWSDPVSAGIAGASIFLIYLSLPELLDVRSGNGLPARSALDGERERAFLLNLTGCAQDDRWADGIRNRRVWRQVSLLGRRHLGFGGMRPGYLDFIAMVISTAPFAVRAELRAPAWAPRRSGYWRYMSHAMSLLSANIGDAATARDRCLDFLETRAAPSEEGRRLYLSLAARHPWYVDKASSALPDRARAVIGELKDARC